MAKRRASDSDAPPEPVGRIWAVVAAIPRGQALSYGEVARRAGLPGRARLVGRALKVAPRQMKLPWQRVVGANGRPAFPAGSAPYVEQLSLLAREGLVHRNGRVTLAGGNGAASLDALLWGQPD